MEFFFCKHIGSVVCQPQQQVFEPNILIDPAELRSESSVERLEKANKYLKEMAYKKVGGTHAREEWECPLVACWDISCQVIRTRTAVIQQSVRSVSVVSNRYRGFNHSQGIPKVAVLWRVIGMETSPCGSR